MKRYVNILACLLSIGMLAMGLALAEEPGREIFTSGDYTYALLEDGTAEIVKYQGKAEKLTVPSYLDGKTVTRIGNSAFYWCKSLTDIDIPDSINSIGDSAFGACENLKQISIPDSVISIGNNPFSGCDNLKTFFVSQEHMYLAIIDGVLFSKPDKRLVSYPSSKIDKKYAIPQGIARIGNAAFYRSNLTQISIPDSVTIIDKEAFASCSNLTQINIPGSVISIGKSAFHHCDNLTQINIPDSVVTIEDSAFAWCKGLTQISLPDNVTSIGANPFVRCNNLTTISISPDHKCFTMIDGVLFSKTDKSLICYPISKTESEYTIPEGIVHIGDGSFSSCEKLMRINLPDGVISIGNASFSSCTNLTQINIPNSVISIGMSAFSLCNNLTQVYIPDSVTSIGDSAFSWCSNLTEINIPDSLTSIGTKAFSGCNSLAKINIPERVTYIGDEAFFGCDKLMITVNRNSYAAQYCKDNSLNYQYPDSLDWLND